MIINYPSYFKKFNCIADKCPDTCCSMWQVVVDKESAEYYKSLNSDFDREICSLMYRDDEGDIVFKNRDNHCPFLNEKKLCNIHTKLGQEHTPCTCKMFPRFKTSFGGTEEWGISLSCPVAAQLIVDNDSFDFSEDFNEDLPDMNELDAELFLGIKGARKRCYDYIKKGSLTYNRLNSIVSYGKALQECVDSKCYDKITGINIEGCGQGKFAENIDRSIFKDFEYLTEKGRKLFCNYDYIKELNFTEQSRNILLYYLYRYMLKSVYDYDVYSAVAFAVFSTIVITNAADKSGLNLADAGRIFSKEIEHSQSNLNSIIEYLKHNA